MACRMTLMAMGWNLTSPGPVGSYYLQACLYSGGDLGCLLDVALLYSHDQFIYDPTNGTVSPGEVRRSSMGIGGDIGIRDSGIVWPF